MTTPTTRITVKAGIAYRETRRQIDQAMDLLKARLNAHQMAAQAIGTDWRHVDDLRAVLASLHQYTQSPEETCP
jgi:hypothetical protein